MSTLQLIAQDASPIEETSAALGGQLTWNLPIPSITHTCWTGDVGDLIVAGSQFVVYEGGNPVLYPEAMFAGLLYPFSAFGQMVVALKDADGTLNLYYIPQPEQE